MHKKWNLQSRQPKYCLTLIYPKVTNDDALISRSGGDPPVGWIPPYMDPLKTPAEFMYLGISSYHLQRIGEMRVWFL